MGVPTLVLARTDAEAANLITSDVDDNDKPFLTGERTVEGFFKREERLDQALSRGLAYAEYADLVWCETGKPDLEVRQQVRRRHPQAVPRQAAGLQLLAVLQLEEATSTTPPSPSSSGSWAPWATSSSSSRWPASIQPELLDVQPGPRLRATT
jgi:isocitrate lyase